MNLEVIVSTMGQKSIDFYKKLNIKSDCLIINQANTYDYDELMDGENKIRMITTPTRGLGRSRNIGLLNSKADIIVIADDDEVFEDDYVEKVKKEFKDHPDTDFFMMKTEIHQDGEKIIKVKKDGDLKFHQSLRYGSVHFAFKRKRVLKYNMSFSTYFGAGTENGSGEDSLFIKDGFKNKLKFRTSTKLIAKIYNDESTWFEGFNEKFFFDKGQLARALFPKAYRLYIGYFIKGHEKHLKNMSKNKAYKKMLEGAKYYGG